MPYRRLVSNGPPDEAQMNAWEHEGWSSIQVLGPCPAMEHESKQRKMVFVVYLWRSIILAGEQVQGPGRRLN